MASAVIATMLVPEGHLACPNNVTDRSPDGAWTLLLCRRAMLMAMPGHGGDAPGWIVLGDAARFIRGVSALDMVQNYGAPVWDAGQVTIPLTVELPLPPPPRSRLRAWLEDRIWRLQALMGVTSDNDDFY